MSRPVANQKGNRTKRPQVVALVPSTGAVVPDAPVELEGNEFLLDLWDRLWREHSEQWQPLSHLMVVTRYFVMQIEALEIESKLGSTMVQKGSQGQTVLHPLRRHLADVRKALLGIEKELGLTPEASIRLGFVGDPQESRMDEFQKRWNEPVADG